MEIRISNRIEDSGISPEQWNELAFESRTSTVFQTYEWHESWWRVFGNENSLLLISAFGKKGDLLGIAPVMISKKNRALRFIGDDKADYCDIICRKKDPEAADAIVREIIRQRSEWDSACLRNIPEDSNTCALLSGISAESGLRMITNHMPCPTLIIAGREAAALELLRKKTLRRRHNHLQKKGMLDFRHIGEEKEALRCLDLFFEQHMKRREMAGDKSLFADARNRKFYERLTKGLLEKGWLLFSVLEFNRVPIAFHFGFDYGSRVIWYKPSFDTDYSRHSPGKLMLMHLIRYAVENGRTEFDFTLGDEPFKRQFTNHVRRNRQVSLYKSNPAYLLDLSKKYILKAVRKTRSEAK